MDDKKKGTAGRGSLLAEAMRQREQQHARGLSHSLETPTASLTDSTRSSEGHSGSSELQSSFGSGVSTSRGRGQLVSLMRSMGSSKSESRSPPSGMGRGSLGRGSLLKQQPR